MPRSHAQATGTESGRKLLSVLLCFSGARPLWTVADIAAELSLRPSSVYRYVALLREVGLLEAGAGSTYRVTDRVLALAEANAASGNSIVDAALPVMTSLRDAIGETVLIARRSGESALLIDRVESRHPVRLQFERGQEMALHAGSMPRLLLAHMPAPERDSFLNELRPHLTAEQQALVSDAVLAELRRTGACESYEEIDEGIWGTAAVVRRGSDVLAVIGTAGPVYRLDADRRAEVRTLIAAAAAEISAQLS